MANGPNYEHDILNPEELPPLEPARGNDDEPDDGGDGGGGQDGDSPRILLRKEMALLLKEKVDLEIEKRKRIMADDFGSRSTDHKVRLCELKINFRRINEILPFRDDHRINRYLLKYQREFPEAFLKRPSKTFASQIVNHLNNNKSS